MTQQSLEWFPHTVAVGPISAEEAAGITQYGDISRYAPEIEKLAAG